MPQMVRLGSTFVGREVMSLKMQTFFFGLVFFGGGEFNVTCMTGTKMVELTSAYTN